MKTILFIGQAPARPASKHEIPGTYLHTWLHAIGISDNDIKQHCHFYALTDAFPGSTKNGHLPPTAAQIALHKPTLLQALGKLKPDILVPVGKMAIGEVMNMHPTKLEETVGQQFQITPFGIGSKTILCIPLSHPSGRNAWNHMHKPLVQRSLQLLQQSSTASEKTNLPL